MQIQLLLGVLASGILELTKLLSKKFGEELSKKIVYITLFLLVLLFTVLTNKNIISKEMINSFLITLSGAVTTYQLIIKKVTK